MQSISISLLEWQSKSPESDSDLQGLNFGNDESVRRMANVLSESGRLGVSELATGLSLAHRLMLVLSGSGISKSVHPKISGSTLLSLLRYAYGMRNLSLYSAVEYGTEAQAFQDLLITN
jgi:5-methylcytosine-specific restriction enzyme subunit McrC